MGFRIFVSVLVSIGIVIAGTVVLAILATVYKNYGYTGLQNVGMAAGLFTLLVCAVYYALDKWANKHG